MLSCSETGHSTINLELNGRLAAPTVFGDECMIPAIALEPGTTLLNNTQIFFRTRKRKRGSRKGFNEPPLIEVIVTVAFWGLGLATVDRCL